MDRAALVARWRALPTWARWSITYAACTLAAGAVAAATPLVLGDAFFAAGAISIVGSLLLIRTGGEHKKVRHRDIEGNVVIKERVPVPQRRTQISIGMKLFLLGMALWAPLIVAYVRS